MAFESHEGVTLTVVVRGRTTPILPPPPTEPVAPIALAVPPVCRCYGARYDGRCEHEVPRGPSSMPSCPADCACLECYVALRRESEARTWTVFRKATMLPPAPDGDVPSPEPAPLPPFVGDDIVQTSVATVRPLARRVA